MAWRIWGTSGKGALYVGQAEHAKAWAWSNVDAIVNCAQYDFKYWLPDMTQHRWLHIQERSWFNGRGWYQRMRAILLFVILHLAAGRDALLHCWAGKHRSGVFGVLLVALLRGCSWEEAELFYFKWRPLDEAWDQQKVQRLARRHHMAAFLDELRTEGFCQDVLRNMQSVPEPKVRPQCSSSSSSPVHKKTVMPLQNKESPKGGTRRVRKLRRAGSRTSKAFL